MESMTSVSATEYLQFWEERRKLLPVCFSLDGIFSCFHRFRPKVHI
jgi:hypothetical protein